MFQRTVFAVYGITAYVLALLPAFVYAISYQSHCVFCRERADV